MLRAVDFFCGAGGVTNGFSQAKIRVLGGIDKDKDCEATYTTNHPESVFIPEDISELTFKQLKRILKIKKNDNKLIFVGCSPCQYYTNLRTDKTKSQDSRMLLEVFQEFVDHFRPGFVFIENVPGLEKDSLSPLSNFKHFLTQEGYTFDDGIVNARYFGVPQNRRRYILIATRLDRMVCLPEGSEDSQTTVARTIGDESLFPRIEAGHYDPTPFIHSAARLEAINLARIRNTPADGGSRRAWAADESLQLDCYQHHDGHSDVYGRMRWQDVSPTITTKFFSLSNGRYGHPVQDRAISLREGAMLQSFDKDYRFIATRADNRNNQAVIGKMIGNAVPPKMAQAIGEYIVSLAAKKKR